MHALLKYCACTVSKMTDCTDSHTMQEAVNLCNGAISEKATQLFWPLLPVESFSGRTDAQELINGHTHKTTIAAHARHCIPRVNNIWQSKQKYARDTYTQWKASCGEIVKTSNLNRARYSECCSRRSSGHNSAMRRPKLFKSSSMAELVGKHCDL